MSQEKFTRFDGRLHFFQYPSSPYWYVGFHFKGKYVRKTTKTTDRNAAIVVGEKWFTLKQAEILTHGQPLEGFEPTVADFAPKALAILDSRVSLGERSKSYRYGVARIINSDILPFFGKLPLSKVDVVCWNEFVVRKTSSAKPLSRASIHQCKNALRSILKVGYMSGVLKSIPLLQDPYGGPKIKQPRSWFEPQEYQKLLRAIRAHQKTLIGTRWENDCAELYDYVLFNCNAGLRVGEARNVRFCDVSIHEETNAGEQREFLLIKNIQGKRGTGECRTMDGAVIAYRNILRRRNIDKTEVCEEPIFLAYHRDMFRAVLEKADLRFTRDRPPRKRDLTVCRHTYISFRLLNGANAFEVANNCRTSTQMIQEHYARWLSPRLTQGLNIRKFSSD